MASSGGTLCFLFLLAIQIFNGAESAPPQEFFSQFHPTLRSSHNHESYPRPQFPWIQPAPKLGPYTDDQLTVLIGTELEVPYPLYKEISESFLSTTQILALLPNNTIVQVSGYAGLKDIAKSDGGDTKVIVSADTMIPASIYLRIVLINPEEVMVRLPDGQILPNQIYQERYGKKEESRQMSGQTYFSTVSPKESFPFLVVNDHKGGPSPSHHELQPRTSMYPEPEPKPLPHYTEPVHTPYLEPALVQKRAEPVSKPYHPEPAPVPYPEPASKPHRPEPVPIPYPEPASKSYRLEPAPIPYPEPASKPHRPEPVPIFYPEPASKPYRPEPAPVPYPEPASKQHRPEPVPIFYPEPASKPYRPEPAPVPYPEPASKQHRPEPVPIPYPEPASKSYRLEPAPIPYPEPASKTYRPEPVPIPYPEPSIPCDPEPEPISYPEPSDPCDPEPEPIPYYLEPVFYPESTYVSKHYHREPTYATKSYPESKPFYSGYGPVPFADRRVPKEPTARLPPGVHVVDTARCGVCDPSSHGSHFRVFSV